MSAIVGAALVVTDPNNLSYPASSREGLDLPTNVKSNLKEYLLPYLTAIEMSGYETALHSILLDEDIVELETNNNKDVIGNSEKKVIHLLIVVLKHFKGKTARKDQNYISDEITSSYRLHVDDKQFIPFKKLFDFQVYPTQSGVVPPLPPGVVPPPPPKPFLSSPVSLFFS